MINRIHLTANIPLAGPAPAAPQAPTFTQWTTDLYERVSKTVTHYAWPYVVSAMTRAGWTFDSTLSSSDVSDQLTECLRTNNCAALVVDNGGSVTYAKHLRAALRRELSQANTLYSAEQRAWMNDLLQQCAELIQQGFNQLHAAVLVQGLPMVRELMRDNVDPTDGEGEALVIRVISGGGSPQLLRTLLSAPGWLVVAPELRTQMLQHAWQSSFFMMETDRADAMFRPGLALANVYEVLEAARNSVACSLSPEQSRLLADAQRLNEGARHALNWIGSTLHLCEERKPGLALVSTRSITDGAVRQAVDVVRASFQVGEPLPAVVTQALRALKRKSTEILFNAIYNWTPANRAQRAWWRALAVEAAFAPESHVYLPDTSIRAAFDCPFCLESKTPGEAAVLAGCARSQETTICRCCAQNAVMNSQGRTFEACPCGCGATLSIQDMLRLDIPMARLEGLALRTAKSYLAPIPNWMACQQEGCCGGLQIKWHHREINFSCEICHAPANEGEIDRAFSRILLQGMLPQANPQENGNGQTRACYHCSRPTEKTGGCLHMQCEGCGGNWHFDNGDYRLDVENRNSRTTDGGQHFRPLRDNPQLPRAIFEGIPRGALSAHNYRTVQARVRAALAEE